MPNAMDVISKSNSYRDMQRRIRAADASKADASAASNTDHNVMLPGATAMGWPAGHGADERIVIRSGTSPGPLAEFETAVVPGTSMIRTGTHLFRDIGRDFVLHRAAVAEFAQRALHNACVSATMTAELRLRGITMRASAEMPLKSPAEFAAALPRAAAKLVNSLRSQAGQQ